MAPHVNRIAPQLPASSMRTFSIASPVETHTRKATCAEVDCEAHAGGWLTPVDERTELGRMQAAYIRTTGIEAHVAVSEAVRLSGTRRYTESTEGDMTVFAFPAGTTCFTEHRVPLERPELFVVRDGDWRGNPRGTAPRRHASGADWVEEFAEHQDRLSTAQERG